MIIDIDIRDDAEVLEPLISRLTASTHLPVLLVGGKSIGSVESIRTLSQTGELREIIIASGATIGRSRRGKHRRRES
jgi:glutaredoxin-related protein